MRDPSSCLILVFFQFQPASITKGAYSHLLCSDLPYSLSGVYHGILLLRISSHAIPPGLIIISSLHFHHITAFRNSIRSYFPTPSPRRRPPAETWLSNSRIILCSRPVNPQGLRFLCRYSMPNSFLPRICTSGHITYTIVFIPSYQTRTRALKKKRKGPCRASRDSASR